MHEKFLLKPMAAARVVAEVTALIVMAFLPLGFYLSGNFQVVSMAMRVLLVLGTIVALCILPAYGFVTYKVQLTLDELATYSLFKRQAARWADMKTLKLRSSWGWRRYIVTLTDKSELMFPVWLENLNHLCEEVRRRLPDRGTGVSSGTAAPRVFNMSASMLAVQTGRTALAGVFVGLLWQFVLTAPSLAKHPDDRVFMIGACTLISLVLVGRLLALLLMARVCVTDSQGLQAITWVNRQSIPWGQITSIAPTFFLLPEGLTLRAGGKFVLLGDQMDSFDELQEELLRKVPLQAVAQKSPEKKR